MDFIKDDFVLIGSDGIFEVLSNQELADFVNSRFTEMAIGSQDAQRVAEELIQQVYQLNIARDIKESDNLTAVIIPLTRAILRSD